MKQNKKLGRLEKVNIRDVWPSEPNDFSDWLSHEKNLELLSDAVGLTLTNVEKEVRVGRYSCDLVAVDEITGSKVVIENQLEATDHDHLAKIILYASGLGANAIIWIVKEAKEEYRAAIEWLNSNMDKEILFFLLEIHAYKIGESLTAPKFEVIEKPNYFVKEKIKGKFTKTEKDRLDFWLEFDNFLNERNRPFNIGKASIDHWSDVAMGTTKANIRITLVNRSNKIGVEVNIRENKELFDELFNEKVNIEKELGFSMEWDRLDDKKESRIKHYIEGLDFNKKDNYPELMEEIFDKVVIIRKVFKKYI